MVHPDTSHVLLESNDDRRDAVRQRATPSVSSLAIALLAVLVVGLGVSPTVTSLALSTFGLGVAVGRRL